MDKLNQLSNFAAMKEAAVQAATKAAGQMAGQLTQDRAAALAQRLVTRLNEHIRSSGLDPFKGPEERTVEFTVPLLCGFCPCCGLRARAKLKDCEATGLASLACAEDDAKVTVDGSSFKATFQFKAGPLKASFATEAELLAGCCAGCISIPQATILITCEQICLRLSLEGDFAEKRVALITADSGLAGAPVLNKPEIRCPETSSSGSRRLTRLAKRLATDERQRLVDLFQGQLMETVKTFVEDPKALASL